MLLKENAIRRVKYSKGKNRYNNYIFECIGCGKEIEVQPAGLKKHSGKCMRCVQLKEPYRYIYNELKSHKKENKEVIISFEDFLEIIHNPSCHYCNVPLIYEEYSRYWGQTNSRAHQLDRKNNDLGYLKENLVPCCWECNRLKSDRFTYEEFIQLSPILNKIMCERQKQKNIS